MNSTIESRPSSLRISSSRFNSGPSPAIANLMSGLSGDNRLIASSRCLNPFFETKRPAANRLEILFLGGDDSRRLDPRKSRNNFGEIGIDEVLVITGVRHLSRRGHEYVDKLVVLVVDSVWFPPTVIFR